MKAARETWFDKQPELEPERLIFLDECGTNTKMARLYGRARRGERCRAAIPHGHWKTTTLVAGLSTDGIIAPMVMDGAMDGEMFSAYVETLLAPCLMPGDIVIMDNLPAHKSCGAKQAIEARGATLIFLLPLPYVVVAVVGVFRSADNFTGEPQWVAWAKVVILAWAALMVVI